MSERDVLSAYESHLITKMEAIEQSGVESIEELYECVRPEYFVPKISPERRVMMH